MQTTQLAELKVVGIQVKATFEELHTEVPRAWQNLINKAAEIPHRVNPVFVDISLSKEGDNYTELIGAEVSQFPEERDPHLKYITIPAQTYLHHRHEGPVKEIARSYGKIYEHARNHDLNAGEFKIDRGYTADGRERAHDLYVRIDQPRREF